jgi:uncharacterized protein YndB with AHSA1/START domain
MTTATNTSVRVTQRIRATPERLFRAWTDPKELAHWWRMDAPGWSFTGATIDLQVGGRYRLAMTGPDGKAHVAIGEYQEVQRPTRLAFTWEWEDEASRVGDTLVTVELNDVGDNVTEIVLTHERFSDAARAAGHETGWTQLLRLLDRTTQEPAA